MAIFLKIAADRIVSCVNNAQHLSLLYYERNREAIKIESLSYVLNLE